jgi:precorrin-6B methylase 2
LGAGTTDEESRAIAHFVTVRIIEKVTALDIGANLGNWSAELLVMIPSSKIIAFEPSKEAYEHHQKRFANN